MKGECASKQFYVPNRPKRKTRLELRKAANKSAMRLMFWIVCVTSALILFVKFY